MIVQTKEILEQLCRYAILEPRRRGDYASCNNDQRIKDLNSNQCVGNVWYSTGHSTDDCDIDSDKICTCKYRKEK